MSTLTDEIARRRTFAIISHPDSGKTTLTEKLLVFGGAIQLAGEVKLAAGGGGCVRIGWKSSARGISVSSAVMSFEHEGLAFNLLDKPGHQDFSEDTYPFRLSADQPCGCHNRMVLLRISAAHERAGGSLCRELAIPDLNLIKQAKQVLSWVRRGRRWQSGRRPSYPPLV